MDREARQPTMRRAKASTTKATQANPDQVETWVKSDSQSAFGLGAWNCRFTRSRGHGAAGSGRVVFTGSPLTAPASPISAMRRSTVQRAAGITSRLSCRQTFRAP